MVAMQVVEIPKIPYYPQTLFTPPPQTVVSQAAHLTSISLKNLPTLSDQLQIILHLLHHLGVAHAQSYNGTSIDSHIIRPLYDAEYGLIKILHAQKQSNHEFSLAEVLLAEAFQLYFWTGLRRLPPQTELCKLFISRLKKALLPLLFVPKAATNFEDVLETTTSMIDKMAGQVLHSPTHLNNAITWSLALAVAASPGTSEHLWLKEHLRLQLRYTDMDQSKEDYKQLLDMFPTTAGFAWLDLDGLYNEFKVQAVLDGSQQSCLDEELPSHLTIYWDKEH